MGGVEDGRGGRISRIFIYAFYIQEELIFVPLSHIPHVEPRKKVIKRVIKYEVMTFIHIHQRHSDRKVYEMPPNSNQM